MQAKTGILMTGVGLFAGSVGLLVGSQALSANDTTSTRRADGSARYRVAQLTESLAARDTEIVELRQRLKRRDAARPRTALPTKATKPATRVIGVRASGVDFLGTAEAPFNHARASTAAEALGVTEEDLRIAIKAYESVKNAADPKIQADALEALAGLGNASTRAVVAMLRGVQHRGLGNRSIRAVMKSSNVAGQEHLFIDLLKDDISSSWTKREVLRNFDLSDSRAVRDYLVERFEHEKNRYFAADIVMTLGRMQEERAVPLIRKTLAKGGNWVPFDIYSLLALGSIGGREAEAVLQNYLRREKLVHVADALRALAKIDANLARAEAQAILGRPHPPRATLELLRRYAGRSK